MSQIVFLLLLMLIAFILKTIYNYLVFTYDEIPFKKYRIKWLKNEYKKNNKKLLKYLTNVQLDYDIYNYYNGKECKEIGKLGNTITFIHRPQRKTCNCGYKICEKKYKSLLDKLNNDITHY